MIPYRNHHLFSSLGFVLFLFRESKINSSNMETCRIFHKLVVVVVVELEQVFRRDSMSRGITFSDIAQCTKSNDMNKYMLMSS